MKDNDPKSKPSADTVQEKPASSGGGSALDDLFSGGGGLFSDSSSSSGGGLDVLGLGGGSSSSGGGSFVDDLFGGSSGGSSGGGALDDLFGSKPKESKEESTPEVKSDPFGALLGGAKEEPAKAEEPVKAEEPEKRESEETEKEAAPPAASLEVSETELKPESSFPTEVIEPVAPAAEEAESAAPTETMEPVSPFPKVESAAPTETMEPVAPPVETAAPTLSVPEKSSETAVFSDDSAEKVEPIEGSATAPEPFPPRSATPGYTDAVTDAGPDKMPEAPKVNSSAPKSRNPKPISRTVSFHMDDIGDQLAAAGIELPGSSSSKGEEEHADVNAPISGGTLSFHAGDLPPEIQQMASQLYEAQSQQDEKRDAEHTLDGDGEPPKKQQETALFGPDIADKLSNIQMSMEADMEVVEAEPHTMDKDADDSGPVVITSSGEKIAENAETEEMKPAKVQSSFQMESFDDDDEPAPPQPKPVGIIDPAVARPVVAVVEPSESSVDEKSLIERAEMLAARGTPRKAIEIYTTLVKKRPKEKGYHKRLDELWAEVRKAEAGTKKPVVMSAARRPIQDDSSKKPIMVLLILAGVFIIGAALYLGFVSPGWFK